MEIIWLVTGFMIIAFVMFDFFYTTLSGSGASFITYKVSLVINRFQLFLFRFFGRKVFKFSGLIINVGILSIWLLIIWLGLFLIFSYDPEGVLSRKGIMATPVERIYFTGYLISTLGLGDFTPSSAFYQVISSIFSFFGFIFFTTSMTYLVSLFSALMNKRTLALTIRKLGSDPFEVIATLRKQDVNFTYDQLNNLQQMVDKHAANHQSYPVLHYFISADSDSALSINLTVMDEAISLLFTQKGDKFINEIMPLRRSIDHFLNLLHTKYKLKSKFIKIEHILWEKRDIPDDLLKKPIDEEELEHRRHVLDSLLETEGFKWKDIYSERIIKEKDDEQRK